MQLTVRDDHQDFNRQTHAYAEYRAFAGLAGHPAPITGVTVTLERGTGAMRCAVSLTLQSGEVLGTEASGPHIYAAIDRAVALLSS
ncbi:MAG TPA: HPF/RaiA family ribosome-associated protein [Vicinamibacterales bacterium]